MVKTLGSSPRDPDSPSGAAPNLSVAFYTKHLFASPLPVIVYCVKDESMIKTASAPKREMTFKHSYARSVSELRVVYIEYQGLQVHSVTAEEDGIQYHFDFDKDCKEFEKFMFYHSGSGGKITEIQAPHYAQFYKKASYWIHPEAKIKGRPINILKRKSPIKYKGDPNPFNNGREIRGQEYCKFCKKWYDEDACPDHHVIVEGELKYFDGSEIEG
jgi:hypothetical protein